MILSIGTDIVHISRIEQAMVRNGQRFLQRIYTQDEQEYCEQAAGQRRIIRYANRFAAKEALFKILGTNAGISWRELEVVRDSTGKPSIELHGQARDIAQAMIVNNISFTYRFHLSLSDDMPYSVAFVVMEAVQNSSAMPSA